jgi:hypothetical protein
MKRKHVCRKNSRRLVSSRGVIGFDRGTTSLTPAPSPNGEGSRYYYKQIKGAFLHIEETPFSLQGNALFKLRRAFP